jgi:two-component system NarL family sensor kinase
VDVQVAPVDLDELIADVLTELQYLAHERKIHLDYTCLQSPPPVQGEALQLKRVLANLIHNALNYTPSGGRIEVRLKQEDSQVRVEVQDTGPGLSPHDLENVFHRFYRSGGDRQVIGTGLGLYLSRQIIQAHKGRIWAENTQPSGCRFIFKLPVVRKEVLV